jgi:hypothetical protein
MSNSAEEMGVNWESFQGLENSGRTSFLRERIDTLAARGIGCAAEQKCQRERSDPDLHLVLQLRFRKSNDHGRRSRSRPGHGLRAADGSSVENKLDVNFPPE